METNLMVDMKNVSSLTEEVTENLFGLLSATENTEVCRRLLRSFLERRGVDTEEMRLPQMVNYLFSDETFGTRLLTGYVRFINREVRSFNASMLGWIQVSVSAGYKADATTLRPQYISFALRLLRAYQELRSKTNYFELLRELCRTLAKEKKARSRAPTLSPEL